jgi:hypothetical protein
MVPAECLRIEVVYCPRPGVVDRVALDLRPAATVADALRASGVVERHGLDLATLRSGIWGRAQPLDTPLRERDRVEVYRPLTVDPKEARRLRYRRHRAAGGR